MPTVVIMIVIFCFALSLPQILDKFQNQCQFWKLLVLTISKHPLHVQFDQVKVKVESCVFNLKYISKNLGQIAFVRGVLKLSGPADSKTDTGFEICPRFVGVIGQNQIQQTYDHD